MDDDDAVIEAFGVLLTQLRTARRALENIDRSTATYTGFEFAKALADGAEFGQPPMYQGALMVHVVNIDDLAPGNGFGGFIEAIFGGIGNFVSNLVGGLAGSFLTSLQLPEMLAHLDSIVANVREILRMVGVGEEPAEGESPAEPSESLLTTLNGIRDTVRDVTALFQAASAGPAAAAETSQAPMTRTGEAWMAILDGVNRLLDRATYLVDGLVLLIPNLVGGLAFLIANLGRLRDGILETVQFILRNALVLRGVVLTVIFETVASAARLAASVVGIIATTIESMLASIVDVVRSLLGSAFDAFRLLADGLRAIVQSLLQWLANGVVQTLRAIGDLPIFRTIDHLVRILPSLLGPVYMIMTKGTPLPPVLQGRLDAAHDAAFSAGGSTATGGGAGGSSTVTIGEFPDLALILDPLEATLTSAVDATASTLTEAASRTFDEAGGTLAGLGGRFDRAAREEADFSRGVLDRHVGQITANADQLTTAITRPLAAESGPTGMEAIANAYESWLTTGGGMTALLGQIERHFTERPESGEPGGPLGLRRGQFDRPRASIEIDQVEIVIDANTSVATPPVGDPPPDPGGVRSPTPTDEEIYLAWVRYRAELEDRGVRAPDLATALA